MIHRTAFEPRSPLTSSIFNSLHTAGFIKTRLTPKTALQVFLCRYFKLSRRKNKSPSSKMVCSDFRLMIPVSILEFKQQFCSAFPSFSIRSSLPWSTGLSKLHPGMAGPQGDREVTSPRVPHASLTAGPQV